MREKEDATFTQTHFSSSPLNSTGRDVWAVSATWKKVFSRDSNKLQHLHAHQINC